MGFKKKAILYRKSFIFNMNATSLVRLIVSTILGILIGFSATHIFTVEFGLINTYYIRIICIVLITLALYKYIIKYAEKQIKSYLYKDIVIVLLSSIILSFIFASALSPASIIRNGYFDKLDELVITAIGEKSEDSDGIEVWIRSIKIDGKEIAFDQVEYKYWLNKDNLLVSYQNKPIYITYKGQFNNVEIEFEKHPWAGLVKVKLNNEEKVIDLYSELQKSEVINFNKDLNIWDFRSYFMEVVFIIFTLTFLVLLFMIEQYKLMYNEQHTNKYKRIFYYSIPCLIIFSIYWLSFYPAIMSADSIDMWWQISEFKFKDWHPVFYTFFMWIITRVWFSPSTIAIAQIMALSLTIGCTMYLLESKGYSSRILLLASVLFSVFPINGLYSISLWKDIPYSISLMTFTLLLFIICVDETWLKKRVNILLFSIIIVFVTLFRHNGIIPATGSVLLTLLIFKRHRKQLLRASLISLVIIIIIKVPVYKALNVTYDSNVSSGPLVQYLGALIVNDVEFDEAEKQAIERLAPISVWKSGFNKYYVGTSFAVIDWQEFKRDRKEYIGILFRKGIQNIDILIEQFYYLNMIAINPIQPKDAWFFNYPIGITTNEYGLVSESKLPDVNNYLLNIINIVMKREYNWFFALPALYIYLSIMFCFIYARKKGYKYLILLSPTLLNILSVMIHGIFPHNTRYIYSVFLLFPFFSVISICKPLYKT